MKLDPRLLPSVLVVIDVLVAAALTFVVRAIRAAHEKSETPCMDVQRASNTAKQLCDLNRS